MNWIKLKRSKIKVFGKPVKVLMKGMTAPEEHTHFLHSILTNNIKALKPGTFNYNLRLKQNGQPIGDFFVYKLSDYYILDTEIPAEKVIDELNRLKLSLKVYFEDLTSQMEHIFIFGEGSSEFVKDTFGVSLEDFQVAKKDDLLIGKNPVRLKMEGYDIIGNLKGMQLPADAEISETEFEDLRIERCVPKIGKELREGFSPLEAGVLNYAIDMNKGCYVGQEAIARVYFRGRTPRILVKMNIKGNVSDGDSITLNGKAVGVVTSIDAKGRLALGYVLRSILKESKELETEGGKVEVLESCE